MINRTSILAKFGRNVTGTFPGMIVLWIFIVFSTRVYSQDSWKSAGPLFMESVWLTTDRSVYLPGEEISFSAFVVEMDTYTPSKLSKILKVELIDKEGNRLVKREFYLVNSRTTQKIPIPASSSGNWYYIRAYTNWMRNSPDALTNFLPIKIIRPEDITGGTKDKTSSESIVTVFPENEDLIAGTNNNCAVKIDLANGNSRETKAALISNNNDTLARFSTDKTGWGIFSFVPSVDDQYSVVIPGNHDSLVKTVIPKPVSNVSYGIFQEENGTLNLSVRNVNCNQVKVLIHRNYTLFEYHVLDVNHRTAFYSVPARKLPDGMIQFTLLSEDNTILFRRLFLNHDPIGSKPAISIHRSDNDTDSIKTEIRIEPNIASANQLVDVVVTRNEPFNYFDLYIPGIPGWHFSYDIPANPQAREGWLLANSYGEEIFRSFFDMGGNELFSSPDKDISVIDKYEEMFDFLPETRGYTLSGKVTDETGKPIYNMIITATRLKDNNLFAGSTFRSGNFHITLPDQTGVADMVVSFLSKPDPDWNIFIEPRFDTARVNMHERDFTVTDQEAQYIRDLYVNTQLAVIYDIDKQILNEQKPDSLKKNLFFGMPDQLIVVDDYVKLSNIREVLYEVVPGVIVRKTRGSYKLEIMKNPPLPSQYSPLFLLDGIPLFDFDKFLELPPDRFLEIQQINKLYIHGNAVFSGIVSIQSVNNDLAGLELPRQSLLHSIELPSRSIIREFPGRMKSEVNIPELDNTLYWNTSTGSNFEELSFTPNDNFGTYVCRVTGFNAFGQWVYNKAIFNIGNESLRDE